MHLRLGESPQIHGRGAALASLARGAAGESHFELNVLSHATIIPPPRTRPKGRASDALAED